MIIWTTTDIINTELNEPEFTRPVIVLFVYVKIFIDFEHFTGTHFDDFT